MTIDKVDQIARLPPERLHSETRDHREAYREWNHSDVRRVVSVGRIAFVEFTADWCL